MICNKRKFIYIRVAKTGTSSIVDYLFPKKKSQHWNTYLNKINTKIKNWENFDSNHYPLYKVKEVISNEKYNNYLKFSFVRNPYERCVSAWKYNIKMGYTPSEKNLLQFVREKTEKEIILQEPISPLGSKLLKSLNKWK